MKRFLNLLLSSRATIILLFICGVAMAAATFIEDKYDTVTARALIYNTFWFELVFVLLIINLFGHIKAYNLISIKKVGGLIFHLSFVLMILGAAITRYFGFEGSMHIRKGESSNTIFSNEQYLMVSYADKSKTYTLEHPINIGAVANNSFNKSISTEDKGKIDVKLKEIVRNAVTKIEENVPGGKSIIELSVASGMGMQAVQIKKGEVKSIGKLNIAYNVDGGSQAVKIVETDGKISIVSPYDFIKSTMAEQTSDTLKKDSIYEFTQKNIYKINGHAFMYTKHYNSAQLKLVSDNTGEGMGSGVDALVVDVTVNGKTYTADVFGSSAYAMEYQDFNFGGANIKIGYGNKAIEIPFSLKLNEFILEKYPGSESPSSYKSEVTLIDNNNNLNEEHSIFMNNVLDYGHYRFFQSSYDTDLQGTILSVNHDFWGTLVSYSGYLLLMIGFIITLFSKNSRFHSLRRLINEVRIKRKSIAITLLLLLGLNGIAYSQATPKKAVSKEHAEKLGAILTQTFDGRFAPVNTLAIDLMHKISKKENFNLEGKGKLNASQAFLDIMADPEFWQQQKIIHIPQKSIRDIIGITTDDASFADFFTDRSQYKLEKYINEAFRKKQNEKNKFDKELLKVDERLNILQMIINGSILKIFPEQNSQNHKWVSWDDNASRVELSGAISIINQDLHLKAFNYSSLMQAYMIEVMGAVNTGDYTRADKILGYISDIQKQLSDPTVIPSESKIKAEIYYNKADIFILLKNIYAVLSILLLVIAFIDIIKIKSSKVISLLFNILAVILGIAFIYHSYGMALRWYITGHAPWSNGYEALILVAWGALLAGFCFARYLKLILGATTLLAFLVLMTASHSSYDPQLTNLQPVLKSYWLIIHVATLTISYGFLGLGFILALMNMFIYIIKNKDNYENLDMVISIITHVIEMLLIIGLFLATLGTFLGAVWANESWGKYWGWDAKETWALIIVVTYSIVLHMRFIPKFNTKFTFNVASVFGFSSVIMTFVGVNYYLSKGMHSYGAGDTPIFPLWAWGMIFAVIFLTIIAGIKEKNNKNNLIK